MDRIFAFAPGRINPALFLRNVLMLCLGLACLAGCSTLRVGYDNADTVAVWWLDRYLDLTPAQKNALRQPAGKLLEWHRREQLPLYIPFLKQVQTQLQGNVTHAELEADLNRVEQFAEAILLQAVPELTDLAQSLSDAQLAHLNKKFNFQNEEFRNQFIIDAQAKRERRHTKKVLRWAHEWMGSFSSRQEERIRMLVKAQPKNNQLWLDERIVREQIILTSLRQIRQMPHDQAGREQAMDSMRKMITALFERSAVPERKAYFEAWHSSTVLLIESCIKGATPPQKAFAIKRLQGWIADYTSLMARAR